MPATGCSPEAIYYSFWRASFRPGASTWSTSASPRCWWHVDAIDGALRHLKEELSPLLTEAVAGEATKNANWQSGAEDLFTAARNLDRLVSRLLAGRYTEEAGNTMLKQLPNELAKVETLLRAESATNSR